MNQKVFHNKQVSALTETRLSIPVTPQLLIKARKKALHVFCWGKKKKKKQKKEFMYFVIFTI